MNKNIWKSIGAVLGAFSWRRSLNRHRRGAARSPGFPAVGQPASDALLLLATAYRTVYSVREAISRRGSANRPMLHALVLGSWGLRCVFWAPW